MSDFFGDEARPSEDFGPPERTGLVRGILLAGVAVLLGVLLLPSATRAPLEVVSSRSSSTTQPSSPSTTAPGRSSATPPTTAPAASSIHVLVANGTSVNGVAGSVTTFLGGKGFQTLTATNSQTALSSSEIFFTSAGSTADANEVASALGLPSSVIQAASSPAPVSSTSGAEVVVVAGQDLASRFSPTTTTAAHS
ncbi:MAG: LytR C-terminal domain-containing protein [Acidimicrobiales bacterium]